MATAATLLSARLSGHLFGSPAWLQEVLGRLTGLAPIVGAVLLAPFAFATFVALAAPTVLLRWDWRGGSPLTRWWTRTVATGLYVVGLAVVVEGGILVFVDRQAGWLPFSIIGAIGALLVAGGLFGGVLALRRRRKSAVTPKSPVEITAGTPKRTYLRAASLVHLMQEALQTLCALMHSKHSGKEPPMALEHTPSTADAAALVSARPDLAPERKVADVPVQAQNDAAAPATASAPTAEDRVVEPPRVVPTSEAPPVAEAQPAPTVPPGGDVMTLEAPPTPVERQLPPTAKRSTARTPAPEAVASEVTAIEEVTEPDVDDEDIALMEQIEPLFVTEDELEPIAGIPWGAFLALAAMTAAGLAGLAVWRARSRTKRAAALRDSRLALRLGRWQMPPQVDRGMREASDTLQNAIATVREQAEQMTTRWRAR